MRSQLKKLLLRSRLPRALASIGPHRAVILRYHSIQPDPAKYANTIGLGIIHSEALFTRQMELIARRFSPVTIDDIVLWLRGAAALPRRAVAITFDDGFADNHQTAAPILARYGLRAAFYVTVSSIGNGRLPWFCRLRSAFFSTAARQWIHPNSGQAFDIRDTAGRHDGFLEACRTCATLTGERQEAFVDGVERSLEATESANGASLMMTWDQVAALRESGHIIGSHTMSHPNLAHCAPGEAMRELRELKDTLEGRLAGAVEHFSYPSPILEPHCTDATTALVSNSGYASAVTCLNGPARRRSSPLLLPRIVVPDKTDDFV
jgi:peptidoglycan/xylan/chitin deacetylase (PgdA/CDA1 family)